MKAFVTGGTGLIGSYVLRALVNEGVHKIIASKRLTSQMDLVKDIKGVDWRVCNLLNISDVEDIVSECEAVIHIAGAVSFSPWKKKEIFRSNVDVTANLVNIALDQEIKRFIHFSSVAALGLSKKMIDESAVWTENNSKSVYSLSKYLGEKEAWRGFAEGLNLSIINPSFTIGGGYWHNGPMSMISKIDKGLKYYPSGTNGCVDVRDVAEMCVSLLSREDVAGRRFICNGHNISHYDLMCMMCDELGKKYPTTPVQGWFGALAWRGASLTAKVSGTETLFSREAYEISSARLSYDNSQSVELLKISYRPLKETIRDTVEAYQGSKLEKSVYGLL